MTTGKVTSLAEHAQRVALAGKSGSSVFSAVPRLSGPLPTITIVVPTYKEVENLPHLIDRIAKVRTASGLSIDVLIMDDNSCDGSAELIASRPETWVQIVVRAGKRGLSEAVLEGFQRARGEILICMDADLSHPPHALPVMLSKLQAGADFVVGSRYVDGGSTSHDWGFLRWLNSRVATVLARPLTTVRDPMAGFFAIRRTTFESGREFNPVGYKIGLELMVKCGCERVVEVPIHFEDRRYGSSKLTLTQQLLYLKHLRRLYIFKYGVWSQLTQFLMVGALGTLVNLALLTGLIAAGIQERVSIAIAIFLSMFCNFLLNRRFSFSVRSGPWARQFLQYAGASSIGALINYAMTVAIMARFTDVAPQMAALFGIAAGTLFNFVSSRYLVFRRSHIRRVDE
jgi:dolichol-phosphate mannosyltransferase